MFTMKRVSIVLFLLVLAVFSSSVFGQESGRKAGTRMVKVLGGVEFAFRWCPPGTFMMGSPSTEADRYSDETQHQVTLTKGFWIMENEVTQEQWMVVMYDVYADILGPNPSRVKDPNLPVDQVSWQLCQAFCQICQRSGVPLYLPTEAQWEYACRAGSTTAYSWGDEFDPKKANGNGSKHNSVPSKSYEPNAWGICGMHGNVYEWCSDWYGDYPSGKVTDPTGPATGTEKVYRGGFFEASAKQCRSACRNQDSPTRRIGIEGFRCVWIED